jgi:small subunit ribosomal protein S18
LFNTGLRAIVLILSASGLCFVISRGLACVWGNHCLTAGSSFGKVSGFSQNQLKFDMVPEAQNAVAPQQSLNPMDYTFMDVEVLTRYVTETGKILPRRITGLTARQQRHITTQIKRSRSMLLMK